MRLRRLLPFVLLLALATVVLAGCGGSSVSKPDVDQINLATDQMTLASSKAQHQILGCLSKKDASAATACANHAFTVLATKLRDVSSSYRQAAQDTKSTECRSALNAQARLTDRAAALLARGTSKSPTSGLKALQGPLQRGEQTILAACHLKLKK